MRVMEVVVVAAGMVFLGDLREGDWESWLYGSRS